MPERLAKTDPFKAITEIIGSGPFRFLKDEFVAGGSAAWEKFDGYVPRQEPPEWTSGGKIATLRADRVEDHSGRRHRVGRVAERRGGLVRAGAADLVPLLAQQPISSSRPSNPQGYIGGLRFNSSPPAVR